MSKPYRWDPKKNDWLRRERGVCFDDMLACLAGDGLIERVDNPSPNHPGQQLFLVRWKDYVYMVPFVENEKEIFLKTVIPSRKATRDYLAGGEDEKIKIR